MYRGSGFIELENIHNVRKMFERSWEQQIERYKKRKRRKTWAETKERWGNSDRKRRYSDRKQEAYAEKRRSGDEAEGDE